MNQSHPRSTIDCNIPNINGNKINLQNNRDSTIQNKDQPSNDNNTNGLILDDSPSISFASNVESIDSLIDVNDFDCLPEHLSCDNCLRK